MENNVIANPKREVSTGIEMNDKDYLNSLLACLKEMAKNYVVVMTESSNEDLFQKYLSNFLEIINLQREVYECMFRNGWYSLEKVDNNKLSQKVQMLSKEFSDLE